MQTMGHVTQWLRDAVHMGRRLRGVAPSPVVYTRTSAPVRPKTGERDATVVAITRLTPDAVTLRLRTGPITFRAGQFVTLSVPVLGRVHRRNYSISCAPPDGEGTEIDLTVKRVPGGVVSTYLFAHAKVGDRFGVTGPHGSFVRPPEHDAPLVLIGAGSGVTPLYSILRSELGRTRDIALLYGNRSAEATIFRAELAALARAHASLRVLHAHEEPSPGDTEVFTGRMDAELIARMLDAVPFAAAENALFFLCGPEPVRAAARRVCAERGIPAARILEERYTQSDTPSASDTAQPVTFRIGGRTVALTLHPSETLLAGATRAGIAAPFSCAMGGCGDCRMRLVSGEVTMEEPNCLLPTERARGEILGCVARPREACVVEVRT